MLYLFIISMFCIFYEINTGIEVLARFGKGVALAVIICNFAFFIVSEIKKEKV